jgi:hypothetical protein
VADHVLSVAEFHLPADYNSTYPDKIRKVSSAEVQKAAQRYLETKDIDIVLAGNVGAFRDGLKKEFPGAQFTEIPFDQVDVLAPNLMKPKQAAAAAN